jgi:isoquinoline 1-oxidoreductase alpha subunit
VPEHSFILNGKKVSVDVEDDVRLLWVLRDILKVNGPKYGCALDECKACTSHLNGKAFTPCSVSIKYIKPTDQVTTIEGLAATAKGKDLHPVQEAWMKHSVPQCGYCQPGQIMAASALIEETKKSKRKVTDDDIDAIRNVCRCNTYPRIREAIKEASQNM